MTAMTRAATSTGLQAQPFCAGRFEIRLETFRGLGLMALEQVSVGVGHVRRGVPDLVADPLEREASVVHQRDVAVSELV
jgi:hypothetical protein